MPKITLIQDDITKVVADAIVNAANASLLGGGGVDGAIHRAGGPEILADCMKIRAMQGSCATGEAVITTAGLLPAQYVIHTVGPVWNGTAPEDKDRLLANSYKNSLKLAIEHKLETIAFPNISTGVYRFPKARAARLAIATVRDFLAEHPQIKEVIFVCFDKENYYLYRQELN